MFAYLEAPLIVFLVIVVPLWLILHYRAKHKVGLTAAQEDSQTIAELMQVAQRMEDRIRTLERILDSDAPQWRGRS